MTSHSLYRTAAVALGLAVVLAVRGFVAHRPVERDEMTSASWQLSHLLFWVGGIIGEVGLVGLYLRQKSEVGRLGIDGATPAAVRLLALTGAYYYEAIIVPTLAVEAPGLMEAFPGDSACRNHADGCPDFARLAG